MFLKGGFVIAMELCHRDFRAVDKDWVGLPAAFNKDICNDLGICVNVAVVGMKLELVCAFVCHPSFCPSLHPP